MLPPKYGGLESLTKPWDELEVVKPNLGRSTAFLRIF
jgi:hypothetical protein